MRNSTKSPNFSRVQGVLASRPLVTGNKDSMYEIVQSFGTEIVRASAVTS